VASDAERGTHGGPFAGLLVVEFGRFIAAPYCAQFLADCGAEVIKVEPTDGDQTRRNGPIIPGEGVQFLNKNRGKKSLAVNLRDERALSAVHELVYAADIVIANFRPGIAEELGLDYDSVAARNERVVYAENTGYGRAGPLAGEAGVDIALQAYSGLVPLTEDGPLPLGNPINDYMAGVLLTAGIASSLYVRERTGRGQRVDVSLLQAALVLQNNTAHHIDAIAQWRPEFVEYLHEAYAQGAGWSEILEERQRRHPFLVPRAYYGFFKTADGVIATGGAGNLLQRRIIEVLGIEDAWVTDPEWEPPADLKSYQRAKHDEVAAIYQSQPTAHWLHALGEAGVPCREYQTVEEIVDNEQAWANAYFTRYEHELLGGVSVVGPPLSLSETPLASQGAPPVLGKHTRALLARGGLDDETIEALIADSAAVAHE
jgi:crotonobetainyl-CoA:carnitine CoA-transferase CaiB-like acyl-CoA transferase